jgi:hypothetical protein
VRRTVPGLLAALAACGSEAPEVEEPAFDYRGAEIRLLDDDLVSLVVTMDGARDARDVDDYARCAAARSALDGGFAFARHVRTLVAEEGGVWTADAIYTFSPTLPRGVRTIDAEVVVEDCISRGIQTE